MKQFGQNRQKKRPNSKKALLDVEQAFVSSSFFHPPSTNHHSPPSPRLSCCVSKTLANSNRFAPTPPFTLSFVFVLRKISIKKEKKINFPLDNITALLTGTTASPEPQPPPFRSIHPPPEDRLHRNTSSLSSTLKTNKLKLRNRRNVYHANPKNTRTNRVREEIQRHRVLRRFFC